MKTIKRVLVLLIMVLAFNLSNAQCKVTERGDDFSSKITKFTSMSDNVYFYNLITDEYNVMALCLKSYHVSLMSTQPTVSILFEDGTIMKFDNEVKYKVPVSGSSFWRYTTTIVVTPELEAKLKESKITKWKLYIFEGSPKKRTSSIELYNCITQ